LQKPFTIITLLTTAGIASAAIELKEGVNYKVLQPSQPTNVSPGKVEVVEVFWYACGHCYLLESKLDAWDRSGRPSNAQLVRFLPPGTAC
jgi:thiol:disulfide interchange protein DsbA